MAKDAAQAASALGFGQGQGNAARTRRLGANLGGTGGGQPGTTYSQYLRPTATGTQASNRTGQGENVNQYGNASQGMQNMQNQMQQYNPYGFMGGFNTSWMAQPNAMDSFSSRYGPGGYVPEWAKEGYKSPIQNQLEALKPKPAPATPAQPAGQAYATGQDALNRINTTLTRALTPEETQQLQTAIGYTGGAVSTAQMQQIQDLIKAHRPELMPTSMGSFGGQW
jgi:hypothetical protein